MTANFFDVDAPRDELEAIHEFLASEDVQLLSAYKKCSADKNSGSYKLAFTLQLDPDVEESLQFYKVPIGGGGPSAHKDFKVGVISILGGVLSTIYISVAKVFSPKLSLRQRSLYSADVAQLLEQLQERISSNLGLTQSGITSLSDEAAHWRQMLQLANNKADTDRANYFSTSIEELHEQLLEVADHSSLQYLEDSIDQINDKLNELWKSPMNFPENRMIDVLDVIALYLVEMCCEQLSNDDMWSINSLATNGTITHVQDIVDNWNQVCDTLTRLFWPNYANHQWLGEAHVPKYGRLLKERINEIMKLRSLNTELSNLFALDDEVTTATMLGQMFRPFRRINILDISSLGVRKWQVAKAEMERILKPIDEKMSILLKAKLKGHLSNPRQMMLIFTKYRVVVTERRSVLEFLRGEKEHFLDSVKVLLEDLRQTLATTADTDDVGNHKYNDAFVSEICFKCRFLKMCEHQIDEILSVAEMLQLDVAGNEQLVQLNSLKDEMRSHLDANFEKWCMDSEVAIKSGALSLRDDQSVVEFDKSDRQAMRVTFAAELITFCYDYRELELLDFRVPAYFKHVVSNAQRFVRHARQLQQIAAFHNTIGDQMIPCQRPIMLKQAVELARLVQGEVY